MPRKPSIPVLKIKAILKRLSRERYLWPEECRDIAHSIAYKYGSGNTDATIKAACDGSIFIQGMLRGMPACGDPLSNGRGIFFTQLKKIRSKKTKRPLEVELEILKHELKLGVYKYA